MAGLTITEGKGYLDFSIPRKIGDRWWLIDPDGGLFLHKAVVAVTPMGGTNAATAFKEKFGSDSSWVVSTSDLLHSLGFNGLGAWSADESESAASAGLPYLEFTRQLRPDTRGGTLSAQSDAVSSPRLCFRLIGILRHLHAHGQLS